MKCMDGFPEGSNYSIYRDGLCPQTSFPISSLRNTWPASSIYQGHTIFHPIALSSCFPSPHFADEKWISPRWDSNSEAIPAAELQMGPSLHLESCGNTWLPPSGLARSSAAWRMNLLGQEFEAAALQSTNPGFCLGLYLPSQPKSFCWVFQHLGQIDSVWARALPSPLQACCLMDKQAAHTSFVSSARYMVPALELVSVDMLNTHPIFLFIRFAFSLPEAGNS